MRQRFKEDFMARYKNGVTGTFSGKIGTVVGVTWRGIHYMRSLPEPSSKPPTAAQLKQREIFAMVNSWLKPLRNLIWIGYQLFADTKTPMNHAVSFVLKRALTENGEIDYPKVVFSRGELFVSIVKKITCLQNELLYMEWENASASLFNNDDDAVTVIIYNPAKQKFVTFEKAAFRIDGQVTLRLPVNFKGDSLHVWMQYVNTMANQVSTSVYLGMALAV